MYLTANLGIRSVYMHHHPVLTLLYAELEGIDSTVLMRALRFLEQKGKAVIFKVNDSEGVKFCV